MRSTPETAGPTSPTSPSPPNAARHSFTREPDPLVIPMVGELLKENVMRWLSKAFALNPTGLNWPEGVLILDIMLVPLVVFWSIGHEEYLLSALFGTLLAASADPGGRFGYRASRV